MDSSKSLSPNHAHDTSTLEDSSRLKFKIKKKIVLMKPNENTQKGTQNYVPTAVQGTVRNRIILVSIILAAMAFNAMSHVPSSVVKDVTMIKIFLSCNHTALFFSLFNVLILTTLMPLTLRADRIFGKIFAVTTSLAVLATLGAYVAASWGVWPDSQTTITNGSLAVGFYMMLCFFSFVIGVVFRPQIRKLLRRGENKIASTESPKTDAIDEELEKVVVMA